MYEIAGYPLKMNKNYHMACSEIIILRSKNIFVEFKILIVMMWKLMMKFMYGPHVHYCVDVTHSALFLTFTFLGYYFSNWLIVTKFHQI